jgi:AsmA protein
MIKWLKWLAAAVGGVVVLLGAVALFIVWRIDPNDYKGYLTDAFEARTGRSLSIDDDLRFELYPWLAVETGGLVVGNAAGFPAQPFATIERVSARVKLLPLLRHEVEVGTVVVDGLTLNLERNGSGHGNWEDVLAAKGGTADGTPAPRVPAAFERFGIAGIRIRDGTVNWTENGALRYALTDIDADTGSIGAAAPVDLDVGFELRDAGAGRSARVQLTARAAFADDVLRLDDADASVVVPEGATAPPIDIAASWRALSVDTAAGTASVEALATRAGTVRADWELAGRQLFTEPVLTGTVHIQDAPVSAAADLLTVTLPPSVARTTLGSFDAAVGFAVDAAARRLSLDSVDVELLDARLTGRAKLGADRLHAEIHVPAFAPRDPLRRLAAEYLPSGIDVEAIGQIGVDAIVDADLRAGTAKISDVRAELLGGRWRGELTKTGARRYRGQLRSSRFAPQEFAAVFDPLLTDTVQVSELGMLSIDTRFDYDGERDTARLDPLALEVFGLHGDGRLTARALSTSAELSGEAHVAEFTPRDLFRRFGRTLPATSDDTVLRSAAIDTGFALNRSTGTFRNLVLRLDDSVIRGDFSVEDFEHPAYRFALSVDGIDVDRYLPPRSDTAAAGQRKLGDIELAATPLDTLSFAGRIEAKTLTLGGLAMQNVGTTLTIGDGAAKLGDAKATLYGGRFTGDLAVDATGPEPRTQLQGKVVKLALEPLITALVGSADFSGDSDFDLDLSGHGKTVTDNVRSAAGRVSFLLRNGAIDGFNLGRTLCAAYNLTQKLPPPPDRPQTTSYGLIRGTAEVTDGVATSSDLLARTSFMDVTGRGRLDLVDRGLSYDLEAKLTDSISIPQCQSMDALIGGSVPLTLRGTLDAPEIRPDFSEILRRRAQDELKKRLQERLQDRLRDLL